MRAHPQPHRGSSRRRWRRRLDEAGYVALLVAIMFPVVFIGCAAISVDTARWYVEAERVQRAADAAALAGVVWMPEDFAKAKTTALAAAAQNGYPSSAPGVVVTVTQGDKASQLKVVVSSTITNSFGQAIGTPTTTIGRSSTADYSGPAPMGSPCNTFGNEPPAGGGTSSPTPRWTGVTGVGSVIGASPYPNCNANPQLWADVEGPETNKDEGDRYGTEGCSSSSVDGCSGTTNSEYNPRGYFFEVRVSPTMVGNPVQLQLYDPAFVPTGSTCTNLPGSGSFANNMNPYVTRDAPARYSTSSVNASPTGASYCSGDNYVSSGTNYNSLVTSFSLLAPKEGGSPFQGTPLTGCTKQYGTLNSLTTVSAFVNALTSSNGAYNQNFAQLFHNWTRLCSFTPTVAGNYFLQVRTNISMGGTAQANTNGKPSLIYSDNTHVTDATGNSDTGSGSNSFGIRILPVDGSDSYLPGNEKELAVSGYDRMPIYANADSANEKFNLIRVLPGAAGQYISFDVFDLGDASGTGTVKITVPSDATGSVTSTPFPGGCRASGGYAGSSGSTSTTCSFTISSAKNNGAVETFSIPVPSDYSCTSTSYGGCWYSATVAFGSGTVHDVTTWDAQIVGDPVRLIQ